MARQANISATFAIATFAALCRPQKCSGAIALFPEMVVKKGQTTSKTREELLEEIANLPVGADTESITLTKNLGNVTIADLFDGEKIKKDLPDGNVTIDNLRKFAREWAEKFEAELFLKLAKESDEGKAIIAQAKADAAAAAAEAPPAE